METRAAKRSQMMIPKSASDGSYTLKTIAAYNGEKALSFFTIRVKAEKVIEEEIEVCIQ